MVKSKTDLILVIIAFHVTVDYRNLSRSVSCERKKSSSHVNGEGEMAVCRSLGTRHGVSDQNGFLSEKKEAQAMSKLALNLKKRGEY